ncbi:hypothetical protein [Mangrovihabitans endophyticus]|uniref:Uncharacterized protein n=1 Tax=Mangrovihabitans endophyticus TaxID=1751298 RepID=A0A8J3BYK9_9ACTN|nr:hypothetical protein [Mangrovihabitans endophyticus]GGK89429.1 hypothetical protein GCM10012284_24270 [Mangrovihabitans endophyticus]
MSNKIAARRRVPAGAVWLLRWAAAVLLFAVAISVILAWLVAVVYGPVLVAVLLAAAALTAVCAVAGWWCMPHGHRRRRGRALAPVWDTVGGRPVSPSGPLYVCPDPVLERLWEVPWPPARPSPPPPAVRWIRLRRPVPRAGRDPGRGGRHG